MRFPSSVNISCISSNKNNYIVLILVSYNNLASAFSVCPSMSLSLPPSQWAVEGVRCPPSLGVISWLCMCGQWDVGRLFLRSFSLLSHGHVVLQNSINNLTARTRPHTESGRTGGLSSPDRRALYYRPPMGSRVF